MLRQEAATALAAEEFGRLRVREILQRVGALFTGRRDELLSFTDVKQILRPTDESYRGVRSVRLSDIVGSEGRYHDFTRSFLPKHRHLRGRWTHVGAARYQDLQLPAIKLYEIGGVYFVRDGNHRVSVARSDGAEYIDAEVTSLSTYFTISPDMTRQELVAAVIEYERQRFNSTTGIDDVLRGVDFRFTTAGRFDVLYSQIEEHRGRLSVSRGSEIGRAEAIHSWYEEAYEPLTSLIRSEGLLAMFPERTEADLYVWILQHWRLLERKYGVPMAAREAVRDFLSRNRRPFWKRLEARFRGAKSGPSGPPGSETQPKA